MAFNLRAGLQNKLIIYYDNYLRFRCFNKAYFLKTPLILVLQIVSMAWLSIFLFKILFSFNILKNLFVSLKIFIFFWRCLFWNLLVLWLIWMILLLVRCTGRMRGLFSNVRLLKLFFFVASLYKSLVILVAYLLLIMILMMSISAIVVLMARARLFFITHSRFDC